MSEAAQIVIAASITVLTIVLSLVGLQIFVVLKEFKKTFEKVNAILTETQNFSSRLSGSLDSFSSTLTGFKTAISLLGFFKKDKKNEQDE